MALKSRISASTGASVAARSSSLEVFSLYHDVGHGSADDVVSHDLAAIDYGQLPTAAEIAVSKSVSRHFKIDHYVVGVTTM